MYGHFKQSAAVCPKHSLPQTRLPIRTTGVHMSRILLKICLILGS